MEERLLQADIGELESTERSHMCTHMSIYVDGQGKKK